MKYLLSSFFSLWIFTSGISQTPELVTDIDTGVASANPSQFAIINQELYFVASHPAYGVEIWKTDGSKAGTQLAIDINAGSNSGNIAWLTSFQNQLFFSAFDGGTNGNELFVSNGTTNGSSMLKDIHLKGSSNVSEITVAGDYLFFSATNGSDPFNATTERGYEPWVSDGTASGTKRYADIYAGYGSSYPKNFVGAGNAAFFIADIDSRGEELYRAIGNSILSRLEVRSNIFDSDVRNMTAVGDRLFFTADDGSTGQELYVAGQVGSFSLVKDIYPGGQDSRPASMCAFNGLCYFAASDGKGAGKELWRSDGTSQGTVLVANIDGTNASSNPSHLTNAGNWLFFMAQSQNGYEPYAFWPKNDSVVALGDLSTGSDNSEFQEAIAINNRLYISLSTMNSGFELWESDGTPTGTKLVKDIMPGRKSSSPENLYLHQGVLYFSANDSVHGRELWKLNDPCNHISANLNVADSTYLCEGDILQLSANFSADAAYKWLLNDTQIPMASDHKLGVNMAGNYRLEVSHKQENCPTLSAEVLVRERKKPEAELTDILDDHMVCPEGDVQFFAEGGDTYHFYYNDVLVQSGSSPTFTLSAPFDQDMVKLVAEKNGCRSSNSAEITISHYQVPAIELNSNVSNNEACDDTPIHFTASKGFMNYTFTVDKSIRQNSAQDTFTFTSDNNYTVTVVAEDQNGCLSQTTLSATMINPPSKPTILQNDDELRVNGNYATYQWLEEGNEIMGATDNRYAATGSGNYSVEVGNNKGCTTLSDDYYLLHSTIEENAQFQFIVFPNPFNEELEVQSSEDIISLDMYDLLGKHMLHANENSIITTSLPVGTYTLLITTNKGVIQQRVVKTSN